MSHGATGYDLTAHYFQKIMKPIFWNNIGLTSILQKFNVKWGAWAHKKRAVSDELTALIEHSQREVTV